MAGVARAAFRTDATIIDSGVSTCIEKFCIRKNIQLIGVAPDAQISYPRAAVAQHKDNELANGHTHFVLIGRQDKSNSFKWGQESVLKFELAKRVASGRRYNISGLPSQKIVVVVNGDNEAGAIADIETALNLQLPIVVIEGSPLCNRISQSWHAELGQQKDRNQRDEPTTGASKELVLERLFTVGKLICSSDSSEEVASMVHLLLTIVNR